MSVLDLLNIVLSKVQLLLIMSLLPYLRWCSVLSIMDPFPPFHHTSGSYDLFTQKGMENEYTQIRFAAFKICFPKRILIKAPHSDSGLAILFRSGVEWRK